MGRCNKVYHLTRESAEFHADSLEDESGVRPNVYMCEACGKWHVGYTESKRRLMSGSKRSGYLSRRERKAEHRRREANERGDGV